MGQDKIVESVIAVNLMMLNDPVLHDLHSLAAAVSRAETPRDAALTLTHWLGAKICPAAVGLLNANARLDLIASPACRLPPAVESWLMSPDSWLLWDTWDTARWLEADPMPAGLEGADAAPALLVPLHSPSGLRGLLWLDGRAQPQALRAQREKVTLLASLLAARIHHLETSRGWDNLVTGINEFTRALSQEASGEELWPVIQQQITTLFDVSTCYVGLLNPHDSQLTLPLVSQDGVPVYYGPVPLTGLSRAIIHHGRPLHFRDLLAETDRLESLGVALDEDETGLDAAAASWIGVPLRSRRGEIIGLVSIQNVLPNCYSDSDLYLLLAVAGQISMAIENRRLLQAEQERRQIAAALLEVGQAVSSTLDYEDVLERVLEQMQRVVSYDSACIVLPAPGCADGSRMIVSAISGLNPPERGAELTFASESLPMRVYQSQFPLVVGSAASYDDGLNRPPDTSSERAERARSWMGVPMRIQQRVIGLIILDKAAPNYYTETDASTVFALARQAAVAVENARLHAQAEAHLKALEQRARRLTSMHSIATVLSSSLDRDVVLKTAARLLADLFGCDHCGIVLIDAKDGHAYVAAEYPETGIMGQRIAFEGSPLFDRLIQGSSTLAIENIETEIEDEETRAAFQHIGAQSSLLAPLIARSRLIGSIGLDAVRSRRRFSQDDHETFAVIAAQVALAIHNAQLYEQAVAVNRLKSELMANMSHELRTPLNAIIGYSEMLLSQIYGELNPKQQDRLSRVHSGGKHLLMLINDILDMSKIEAGEMDLSFVSLSISELIHEVVADVRPQADEKGLALILEIPPSLPQIEADALRVQQILSNLLDNAIKFTETGSITLSVKPITIFNGECAGIALPEVGIPDGEWLAIMVRDTGIGIAADDQLVIFDAFRQVDGSSVRRYEGTGLGLAIARQLIRMHHGHIWVESEPGAGSLFTVLLPVRVTMPPASDSEFPIVLEPGRPVILTVDDDPSALQLVRDYLSDADYQVIGTTNPNHALDIARKLHPAAIISDIMMPSLNGWELLRRLKDDPATADIPVVIVSIIEQRSIGLYLGAADYLVKPISREALRSAVERVAHIQRSS